MILHTVLNSIQHVNLAATICIGGCGYQFIGSPLIKPAVTGSINLRTRGLNGTMAILHFDH